MSAIFSSLAERMDYFRSHRFVRQSVLLQASGLAGTFVQALIGVVMARLLQPELFGVYSLAFGVASVASVFLGTGAQDAITPEVSRAWVNRDSLKIRRALAFLAKIITISIIVTALVALILPRLTAGLYHRSIIGWYAAIVVLASALSTTLFSFSSLTLQITGRISSLAGLALLDQIVRWGLSLVFILAGLGIAGAMSGHLAGALIVLITTAVIWERLRRHESLIPPLLSLVKEARYVPFRPYLAPTLWVALDRNVAILYGALPVALLGIYAAARDVAYFKLAFGYLNIALSVLGPVSTLLNVEFPKTQATEPAKLRPNFIRVSLYATAFSLALTAAALAVSPFVFRLLYGAEYLPSLPYIYGLFFYSAPFGIGVGLGPMWRAIGKVKTSLVINLITLGLGVPLGVLAIRHFHLWGAVAMVTAWYTLSHLASFLYLTRFLSGKDKAAVR